MKINKHIFFALSLAFVLSSCGQTHSEGDGHTHGNSAAEAGHAEEGHEETSNMSALTAEQIAAVGIKLGDIEQKNLINMIKANGVLSVPNNNKANASSLYGGVIKTMPVQLGDRVRKGQVIATISNPQFIQVQEEYLTIAGQIVLAEQELQRQEELNAGNAGARKNLQTASSTLNTLRTRRASLQQQIQLMGLNPASVSSGNLRASLVVTSPIAGTVSNVFAKIGSYVDVSSPVLEIVDNSLLHLDLQIFEKDLPAIKVGQLVDFTITNNPTNRFSAKVFSIGASFEGDSKSVAVHCTVVGNKEGLIDGMNTVGMISLDHVMSPAVPNEAIVEADGKYYVFVQTDKEGEEHHDEEGHKHEEGEEHSHAHNDNDDVKKAGNTINFEKVEVAKGVSEMGYTAITAVGNLPAGAKVVVKGGFFINAKLSNTGGHEH
ncbi:efflux RND transporter periplasmic adaptor subunit [Sphingobacterium bambusae]|uniref:Efflux RND transporter periplasmic adaptor subunit n=1 Tax=Sphingobacterium bambusae TaxID=662858 RepID=A0ABW6BLB4_9SPHI|nr:efflux RND transporter periplasmic adaptor subunit [Sphingobacterium bambusae]WPL49062.1 efflux RND transporter periplasmic adaptor subunit [Sphingobacterium bambusae]